MKFNMNIVPERVAKKRRDWAASDAKRDAGLEEPTDIIKYKNISYGPYDEWNLLDLYKPDTDTNADKTKSINNSSDKKCNVDNAKLPVIINTHGGGYFYGDKELYRFYSMYLAKKGFAVICFNYRLAPEFNFPAPLEDIAGVLKWVSENADEYGLDKDNIFMVGDSAGAQLTSQFAAIYSNPEYARLFAFDVKTDCTIRAISLACGLYRMQKRMETEQDKELFDDYVAGKYEITNPIFDVLSFIDSNYPATFVFSSYHDFLYSECKPMAQFLKGKGIEAKARIYGSPDDKKTGHVFHCDMKSSEGEKANLEQVEFFKEHNGGKNGI